MRFIKLLLAVGLFLGGNSAAMATTYQYKDNLGSTYNILLQVCGSQYCTGFIPTDTSGNPLTGAAGSPSTSAITIQGIASGQPVPASQSGSWTATVVQGTGSNLHMVCDSGCSGSGGTSSNFGSTFPTIGTAIGLTNGTNMIAWSAASNYGTSPGAIAVPAVNADVTNTVAVSGTFWQTTQPVSGTFWPYSLGQQVAASSVPVVLTAAQLSTLTPPAAITNYAEETGGNLATLAGAVSSSVVQSNTKQVNGVTTLTGAGAVGTGSQRVAVGQDTSTIAGSAPGTAGTPSANVVTVQGPSSGGTAVPISAASLPLPSGAATSALQSTINSTLGSPFQAGGLIGNTSFAVTGAFWPYSLGQQLAAASVPVVLTAAQLSTLTPPAAITNYAVETGGNLATTATNTGTTATNTSTANTNLGAPGATACSTDAGSCSLNALLQRIAQRITSTISALGSPFQAGGSVGNTSFGAAASPVVTNPTSTLTMTSATTAYTVGQFIANNATAGSITNPSFAIANSAGGAVISRLRLSTNDTTSTAWGTQTVQVDLWSSSPTWTNGDRGTWSPATGTGAHLGAFTCLMSAEYGDGAFAECYPAVGNAATIKLASGTSVYWSLQAVTGSGVTGASKVWTLAAEIAN